jgi:hypothetical protein
MNNLRNRALKFSCLLLLPLGLLWHPSAHASGDCSDENAAFYTPIDQSYSQSMDCRSSAISMAMLSPGNDTRVNLMLLMADLHGVPEAAKASSDDPPQFGFHSFRGLLFPAAPGTEAN